MRHWSIGFVIISAIAFAAQRPAGALSTDERIAAAEKKMRQQSADDTTLDELAGAYLQKMRETGDGAYLQRAARLVGTVLARDPKNYAVRRRQVEIELQHHHFRQAVEITDRLTAEQQNDALVWGMRGDSLTELGDYAAAEAAYQKMVDLRPGLASYSRIAWFRFLTADAEGAIDIMRQAIRAGGPPENLAWCLADLGNMLFKTGAVAEAERAYRDALTHFPEYHHALAGLARIYAARDQNKEAIQSLLAAQAKVPLPEYAAQLANLYRKLGSDTLAAKQIALLDAYDKLGRAAGESANRNLSLAFSDLEHRVDRGLELARAELQVRADVYTYDTLAWALFRNGRTEEAATAMDQALKLHTPEPKFLEHAARIYAAAGRQQRAATPQLVLTSR